MPVGLGKIFTRYDWCIASLESCDMRSELKFNSRILLANVKKKDLLVQSGQRMRGSHIPVAPQLHIVNGGIF